MTSWQELFNTKRGFCGDLSDLSTVSFAADVITYVISLSELTWRHSALQWDSERSEVSEIDFTVYNSNTPDYMGYRKKLNLRAGISCNSGWDLRSTWAVRYVYNSEVNSVKNVGFKTRQGIRDGERWHQSLREWVTTPQGRWKRQKTHQGGESCEQRAGADEDGGAACVFSQSVALLIALLSSSWVMWTCDETETNYTSNVCMTDAGHTSGHKNLSAPRSAWQHCSVCRQEAVSDTAVK